MLKTMLKYVNSHTTNEWHNKLTTKLSDLNLIKSLTIVRNQEENQEQNNNTSQYQLEVKNTIDNLIKIIEIFDYSVR